MVVRVLLHAAKRLELRQQGRRSPELVQDLQPPDRLSARDQQAQLRELALPRRLARPPRLRAGEGDSLLIHLERRARRRSAPPGGSAAGRRRSFAPRRRAAHARPRSASPPCGSSGGAPRSASGTAIALTVKSRRARSASIPSPRSLVTSTCQARSPASARQLANSSESLNAGPPATRPISLAACPSSPATARSTSSTSLPRAASRIAPPTIQTPSAAPRACLAGANGRSRRQELWDRGAHRAGGADLHAWHPRRDPAGDLVVDRLQAAGHLLAQDPIVALGTDQHRRRAGLHARGRAQVDGHVVHRDRADERVSLAAHQCLAVVREAAANAVPVADRQHPDPGVGRSEPAPAVAGARPGRKALGVGHVGAQLERRLQPAGEGIGVEGVEPVDRDPAASHVEMRGGLPQRGGAVGGVHQQTRVLAAHPFGEAGEPLELLVEEVGVGLVGGGEVGPEPGQVEALVRRHRVHQGEHRVRVALAQAAHAGVVLDVQARAHAQLAPHARRPDGRSPGATRPRPTPPRAPGRALLRSAHPWSGAGRPEADSAARRPPPPPRPPATSPPRRAPPARTRPPRARSRSPSPRRTAATRPARPPAGRSCAPRRPGPPRRRRAGRRARHHALQSRRQRGDHVRGDHRLGRAQAPRGDLAGELMRVDAGAGGREGLHAASEQRADRAREHIAGAGRGEPGAAARR